MLALIWTCVVPTLATLMQEARGAVCLPRRSRVLVPVEARIKRMADPRAALRGPSSARRYKFDDQA